MMPPIKTSCLDHEGSGDVEVQSVGWQGVHAGDRVQVNGDSDMIRKMVEESAAKYAAEKKITPRDCSKEG